VAAVLLSHAHIDHCGNIGMLREDIPIVASPESIVIMKGIQILASPLWRQTPPISLLGSQRTTWAFTCHPLQMRATREETFAARSSPRRL
jgi:glyoxylase-like metal-dependent hydrolase (beta-lactamase superfamily II)